MRVLILGLIVSFAGFFTIEMVMRAWSGILPDPSGRSSAARARALFRRATLPLGLAAGVAGVVLLPAFLLFEPRDADERAGATLIALAAAGVARMTMVAWRAGRLIHVSRRLVRQWETGAVPLSPARWGVRAARVDAAFPVVAVSGLFRSRLLVDGRVIDACTPGELEAIAAHERAHVVSRDNLRRLAVAACHGPASRTFARWRQSAEHAADEYAATTPARAAELAAALIKVARLAPGRLPATALSTVLEGGTLEARVHELLATERQSPAAAPPSRTPLLLAAAATGVAAAIPLLGTVHVVLEFLVRHLP